VYENAARGPGGQSFAREAYVRPLPPRHAAAAVRRRLELPAAKGRVAPRLRFYTTMATWCTACREELPQLRALRAAFSADRLAMAAVPIDPEESRELVEAWGAAHKPPYELLTGLTEPQVSSVKDLVMAELQLDAVPATIVTDDEGTVLLAQWGPPTVSQIRELLAVRGPSSLRQSCTN
jgi:thiol-disulfide isomerase/thioredoxin